MADFQCFDIGFEEIGGQGVIRLGEVFEHIADKKKSTNINFSKKLLFDVKIVLLDLFGVVLLVPRGTASTLIILEK